MTNPSKSVLVMLGENTCVVTFSAGSSMTEKEAVTSAIHLTLSDVLVLHHNFFLQVKSEEWGGAFVDLLSDNIVDKSVVKAVLVKIPPDPRSEVG